MSDKQQNGGQQVAPRSIIAVQSPIPLLDTGQFEHMQRIATGMARASLIPQHLKGKSFEETAANCLMVVNQAVRWNMDPVMVAQASYVVGGKLGYEGKLVAAVINTRAGLDGRLTYEWSGEGPDRKIVVFGTFKGDKKPSTVECVVKDVRTDNKIWDKDPDQKLVYTGAIKWGRRHCPEVVLGVLTDDDLDVMAMRDVTPSGVAAMRPAPEPETVQGGPIEVEDVTDEPATEETQPAQTSGQDSAPPAEEEAEQPEPQAYEYIDAEGEAHELEDCGKFADAVEDALRAVADLKTLDVVWQNNRQSVDALRSDPAANGASGAEDWAGQIENIYAVRKEALTPKKEEVKPKATRAARTSKKAESKAPKSVDLYDENGDRVAGHSGMDTWFRDLGTLMNNASDPKVLLERNHDPYYQWRGVDIAKADSLWDELQAKLPAEAGA